MERASYGCRREPEGESRRERAEEGEPEGESRGERAEEGEPGRGLASDLSDSSDRVQPYPRATA